MNKTINPFGRGEIKSRNATPKLSHFFSRHQFVPTCCVTPAEQLLSMCQNQSPFARSANFFLLLCHPSNVYKINPTFYPGVDIMTTIFCDFSQFSDKKLAFFSKTNVMIKLFQNLALF
jgi:hypothetical protein